MARTFTVTLLGVCLVASSMACSKKKEPTVEQTTASLAPEEETPAEPAPKPKVAKEPWQVPPPRIPKGVNPTRIPVEEDFVAGAAQHIGKDANLKAELDRLAAEIKASGG